ncbi:SPX domain-containing protein [Cladophialophora immunda]|nr:SPX domain-containing protein [Cladophialophora immunda]
MKFGDNFYQRSVPEWAPYNFNYNGMKQLIKQRTSANLTGPVEIPVQGRSRWEETDKVLLDYLRDQYDNVTLFLRMKRGEIDRRLSSLKKQISILRTFADERALEVNAVAGVRGRKYRRLTQECEELGDLIQKVARFASAQKIAFRKILKKYTKWTGSTTLQTRMDVEVFSSNQLQTDYSDYLQELAEQTAILTEKLATSTLPRHHQESPPSQQQNRTPVSALRSPIVKINNALSQAPSAFDAAVMTVPYGEAAGSAFYWIHPDNLDEARALIQRHMKKDDSAAPTPSRRDSEGSLIPRRNTSFSASNSTLTYMVFLDNAQRFVKDQSSVRPSRIAVSAYWTFDKDAAVTLAGLSPNSSGEKALLLDREDLGIALDRDSRLTGGSKETTTVQRYLVEHRDVKPLAEVQTYRTRYSGMTNTADVSNWATLDTSITFGAVDMQHLGELQPLPQTSHTFPHATLHIRWEFARTPAVVRALDDSHLAYRVYDFTLEDMAVRTVQKDLPPSPWQSLLEKDITKLPLPTIGEASHYFRLKTTNRLRVSANDMSGTSSGPSSSEGRADSLFSTATHGQSSITSNEARATEPSLLLPS